MEKKETAPSTEPRPIVLIAEDDPDIMNLVSEELKAEGFQIECAENGQAAWDLLAKIADERGVPAIHAIVSDIMMPKMDGVELLELVRQGRFRDVPFVVMSGALTRELVDQLIAKDVDSVLYKPFRIGKLIEEVRESTRRRALKVSQRSSRG
jgi:CheY-like chemotaxis protein